MNEQNLANKWQISPCWLASQLQVRMISQYIDWVIFDSALKSITADSHTSVGTAAPRAVQNLCSPEAFKGPSPVLVLSVGVCSGFKSTLCFLVCSLENWLSFSQPCFPLQKKNRIRLKKNHILLSWDLYLFIFRKVILGTLYSWKWSCLETRMCHILCAFSFTGAVGNSAHSELLRNINLFFKVTVLMYRIY